MTYLLFFFTFLASVLIYMFFPRNDGFQIEVNQEDHNIVSFLNQHQAAKNYIYQMASWRDTATSPSVFKYDNLVRLMPDTMAKIKDQDGKYKDNNDISESDTITPEDDTFVSAIVCLNNHGDLASCPQNPSDPQYVITYGYTPESWWTDETHRRQVWIKSMLKRSHGSAHCGILEGIPPDAPLKYHYSIFNGEKYTGFQDITISKKKYRIIPDKISDWIDTSLAKERKILICMSEVIPPYVASPIFNIDAINNTGKGYEPKPASRTPIVGSIVDSKIADINTNDYTIVGVVHFPKYEQGKTAGANFYVNFMKNDLGFEITTSCSGDTCYLKAGGITIYSLPQGQPYVFYYSANADGQKLTVYQAITQDETLAGGYTARRKAWKEISQTTNTPGVALTPNQFTVINQWDQSPLLSLRIYNGTLDLTEINHNLKADRKRFGLHPRAAIKSE